MADLDEALFALPGVLNFEATLLRGHPDLLTIAITTIESAARTSGGIADDASVAEALSTIPAIRTSRGQLAVVTTVHRSGYSPIGSAKRTIIGSDRYTKF